MNGTPSAPNGATECIFQAIQGHWLSCALRTLLELGVPEALAATEALTLEEVAARTRVAPQGHRHLYKLLRTAAQYRLLDQLPNHTFAANEATRQLVRQDEQPSLGHLAAHLLNEPKWKAWNELTNAVRQGAVAFALAHHGLDVYQYGEIPGHSMFAREFILAMTYFTKHSLEGPVSLEGTHPWRRCRCIMDVGAGQGALLSRCMQAAGPQCVGILFDRPMVVDSVDLQRTFVDHGVAARRLHLVAGDVREEMSDTVRRAAPDTIVMKHFLSAFSDMDVLRILDNCKRVLAPGGAILLLQTLVPEAGDTSHNTCMDGVAPGLFALEILAQCPGGAWRTLSEWRTLFSVAGLRLLHCAPVGCNMHCMTFVV